MDLHVPYEAPAIERRDSVKGLLQFGSSATDRCPVRIFLPPPWHGVHAMTSIYRPADSVLSEQVDGRVLLINAASDELITLNPVGSVVWQELLLGERDVDELVATVRDRFPDAPVDAVGDDVRGFLRTLHDAGLVEQR
jgi:hypothetical protein